VLITFEEEEIRTLHTMRGLPTMLTFTLSLSIAEAFIAPSIPSSQRSLFQQTLLFSSKESSLAKETSASQWISGSGTAEADMNLYNLPSLEQISQEWMANVVQANSMVEGGIFLGAKSKGEIFVDTVKIQFPRGAGLGIELLELAGGRQDGLGITVVSGLVEGGSAENSGIILGDSIVKIEVQKQDNQVSGDGAMKETTEIRSVATECFGYDLTVGAIVSLPALEEPGKEMMLVTVKRLRRKPKVKVIFQYPPDQGEEDVVLELFSGENLRRAMLVRGIKLNDPMSRRFDNGGTGDCGAEGTCATCAVSVMQGEDLLNKAGQQEAQIFSDKPRWRMACKAIVGYGMKEGELKVRVNPKQWQ
jgi:ferredoxin